MSLFQGQRDEGGVDEDLAQKEAEDLLNVSVLHFCRPIARGFSKC